MSIRINNPESGNKKPEVSNPEPKGASEGDKRKLPLLSRGNLDGSNKYKMDTEKTIEHMQSQMNNDEKGYFEKQINAGGGINNQRAHLRGSGKEYYMTSSADKKASGNFLTTEHPGKTAQERKENLQLPPENNASNVDKVVSKKPTIVLTSNVAPQKKWAEQSDYKPREGIKQTFTPNLNKKGAIADGIYEIKSEKDESANDIQKRRN